MRFGAEAVRADADALATTKPTGAAPPLDPEALRARPHDEVIRLAEVLPRTILARRKALRSVLAGPAEALPVATNRAPQNREKPPRGGFYRDGEPNGILRELNITIPFEVIA